MSLEIPLGLSCGINSYYIIFYILHQEIEKQLKKTPHLKANPGQQLAYNPATPSIM